MSLFHCHHAVVNDAAGDCCQLKLKAAVWYRVIVLLVIIANSAQAQCVEAL
jgi:hypothetical protein